MKEYKLSSWPDLTAPYHRMCYRRMLSEMSQRYMTVAQLIGSSSATRIEVRMFLETLAERGALRVREVESDSIFDSLGPIGDWIKRTIGTDPARH
jgi:hypothetical protein